MSLASGSVLLHSKYDPIKEALRYVDAQNIAFFPSYIIITEPGESYLASVFRTRYPEAKLIALRYQTSQFSETDSLWDAVWRPGSSTDAATFLFNLIPDEYLPLTVFLSWKPSDSNWPEVSCQVWNAIASVIKIQSSVMYTRSHFGRRWLSNIIKNAVLSRSSFSVPKTKKNIFLAAAGPSLEKQFPFYRENFFVCAVSASLATLNELNCIPDLCIATDGGYAALAHFRHVAESVPVAFPLEAAIPSRVLETNPLVILNYGSVLENTILSIAGISSEKAFRNGTVSGTGAEYALAHTTASVFIAGLDLQGSKSFSHARPNASDVPFDLVTNRFNPLSSILYSCNRESASLEMYASWFASRDVFFKKRFFRLLPTGRPISGITNIALSDVKKTVIPENTILKAQKLPERNTRKERISSWLDSIREELSIYSDPKLVAQKRDTFRTAILGNSLYIEILQMVSYMDYIQLLKKMGSTSLMDEVPAAAAILCTKTADYLAKLSLQVQQYE